MNEHERFDRRYAQNEEIKVALRGEAILVQTKRIPKNVIRSRTNFNQDGSHKARQTDQQALVPTVAHRIRILKKKPHNYGSQAQDSSYIDMLFETNAYKRGTQTTGAQRKRKEKKEHSKMEQYRIFESPLHQYPRNDSKVSDASGFPRSRNYKENLKNSNLNTKKNKPNKMLLYEKRKLHSQIKIGKSGHNLNIYPRYSQDKFLHDQKIKYARKAKTIPNFSKQNTITASNKDNLGSPPMKRGPNILSRHRAENIPVRKANTFHPKRKRVVKKKWHEKEKQLRTIRIKNELVYSRSSTESGRPPFVPPSSPSKVSRKYFQKSNRPDLADENYKNVYYSHYGPPLCEKLKNWVNAKILEAKIKKLIVFREKNKLSMLSDSETEKNKYDIRSQNGDEWLAYTASDTSFDQDITEQTETARLKSKFPEESYHLHTSLDPYFKSLRVFGRLPFIIVKGNQNIQCKVSRKSCNYILFCITTILLTIIGAVFALEFIEMYNSEDSQSVNQKADQLIFDTYWVIGLISLLNILYVVLWSYSVIFHSGLYLESYLSRWHLALATIKYSPEASVARFVAWSQLFLALYCVLSTLLFFFGNQYWPLFWENGGLIGMLLFRRLIKNPTNHEYFLYMRILGHFIYLYSIYCSRMITFLVLVHCKLIETISRRWNLRLGCVLEKVAFVEPGVDDYTIKTRVIPYTKLFAEQIIITTFARHTGKVFTVAGMSYYTFKGITMFTSLYILAADCLADVSGYKKNDKEIPVRNGKDLKILTDIFIMAQCWIGFLVTSERISKVGSVIMNGSDFVRRYGMVSCRSSYERRFILSMQFAYAPVYDYYINFGFKVDRTFIFKFASAILGFCVLAVLFSPIRWKIENIKQCKNETCVYLSLPKLFSRYIIVNGS